MKAVLALMMMLAPHALAQERPADIDPNTKTQGGADVRGSGADAGGQTDKTESEKPRMEKEKAASEKDKPVSERKPREPQRESEDAAKGESGFYRN